MDLRRDIPKIVLLSCVAAQMIAAPKRSLCAKATPSAPALWIQEVGFASPELNRIALAPRALQHAHAYSTRLRSFFIRSEGGPKLAERPRANRLDHELRLMHELSIECMRIINLFVEYGVMQPPLIRDATSALGPSPSTREALAALQTRSVTLLVFKWSDDSTFAVKLLDGVLSVIDRTVSLSFADQLAVLRDSVRDIRVIWLVDVDPTVGASDGLRQSMTPVRRFNKRIRRFQREVDPSFAEIVGPSAPRFLKPSVDGVAKEVELMNALLDDADDDARLGDDPDRARYLYREVQRFSETRIQSAVNATAEFHYQVALKRAVDGLDWIESDSRSPLNTEVFAPPAGGTGQFLPDMLDRGVTIDVPGANLYTKSTDGHAELFVWSLKPGEGNVWKSPWLWSVQVSLEDDRLEEAASAGVLALTNVRTGASRVRRLRHVSSSFPGQSNSYLATFNDLDPGAYVLRQLPSSHRPNDHVVPENPPADSNRRLDPASLLRRGVRLWRWLMMERGQHQMFLRRRVGDDAAGVRTGAAVDPVLLSTEERRRRTLRLRSAA